MTTLPDPNNELPTTDPPPLNSEEEDFVAQMAAVLDRDADKKLSPSEQPVGSTTEIESSDEENPPAPDDTDSPETGDGGGEDSVAQQDAPPAENSETQGEDVSTPETPTAEPLNLNSVFERFYGRAPSEQEVVGLLMLQRDLASLPPDRLQQVQQAIAGQQVPPTAATPANTPSHAAATPAEFNIPEYIDPAIADTLKPLVSKYQTLEERLAAFEQQQLQEAYARQQAEQQRMVTSMNAEIDKWRAEKNISPEDYIILETQVRQSGLLPSMLAAGQDPAQAARQLFEATYYSNPDFVEREVQRRVAEERQAQSQQMQRTTKSTALAGGGGNKPAANPTKPVTPQQRDAEMAAFLAQVMESQQ